MSGIAQSGIRVIGKNQIHLTTFQKIHAANGGIVGNLDMDSGKFPVEPAQERPQKIPADGIAGTDAQLAAARELASII